MHALLIALDGTVSELDLPKNDNLDVLVKATGGRLVDVVQLTTQIDMWIDDEGVFTSEPNRTATALAKSFGFVHQDYYGPVVLAGFSRSGDTVNLTADQAAALRTRLADLQV
ncbi:uncharacterized protein DUF3846 [Actinocorallia herbida]|uniref:Uncharacterized protein DUF3846 n=1 Tax=Actinocorallia herbida TaxID=58109 RepID=A0A3N1CMQ9_9ACTN|nr:DUF3846 domain-containing protein [Actinocorallia herbida]ROO82599.1 uncharacterized protein DUF3846 [Actinocorallia herbida]